MVYEILDPGNYLTADVTADFTQVKLEEVGPDRVLITGGTGKPRPETLKVNMGYRAGFVGEIAVHLHLAGRLEAKAQRGIAFLKNRLARAQTSSTARTSSSTVGHTSMWGTACRHRPTPSRRRSSSGTPPRCPDAEQARKVFTESVPLYNNGPAGVAGVGTRPPLKELYAIWPCLIPREHVVQSVEMLEA